MTTGYTIMKRLDIIKPSRSVSGTFQALVYQAKSWYFLALTTELNGIKIVSIECLIYSDSKHVIYFLLSLSQG